MQGAERESAAEAVPVNGRLEGPPSAAPPAEGAGAEEIQEQVREGVAAAEGAGPEIGGQGDARDDDHQRVPPAVSTEEPQVPDATAPASVPAGAGAAADSLEDETEQMSGEGIAELEEEGVEFGAAAIAAATMAEHPVDTLGVAIHVRLGPCIAVIAECLPLAEVLATRACSHAALDWVMHRTTPQLTDDEVDTLHMAFGQVQGHGRLAMSMATDLGVLPKVYDRIRTRLWIQRTAELNRDNSDETTFETQVRSFANDALRRRMEAEMAEAKTDMERQIHAFQAEVDRRMEEQAYRVHTIVEERVQQQLDGILATEMEKVRALVEERVQSKVRAVVQREVHATVCEMQVRLAVLARENDRLRTLFLEHLDHNDLCFKSLVWALSPIATGMFARALRLAWFCQRRFTRCAAWLLGLPPDRRRERLRTRLEAIRRAAGGYPPEGEDHAGDQGSDGLPQSSGDAPGRERELGDFRRQLSAPATATAALAGEGGAFDGSMELEQPLLAMALRMAADQGAFRGDSAVAAAEPGADQHGGDVPEGATVEDEEPPVAAPGPPAAPPAADAAAAAEDAGSAAGGEDEAAGDAAHGGAVDAAAPVEVAAAAAQQSAPFADGGDAGSSAAAATAASASTDAQAGVEAAAVASQQSAPVADGDDAWSSAAAANAASASTDAQAGVEELAESAQAGAEEQADNVEDDDEYVEALGPSDFAPVQAAASPLEEHVPDPVAQRSGETAHDDDVFEDAHADLPCHQQEEELPAAASTGQ